MNTVEDPFVGMLVVDVIEAKGLPKLDRLGKCDPYVLVEFGSSFRFQTQTIKNTCDPKWEENFRIAVKQTEEHYDIKFSVFDRDTVKKDQFIGVFSLSVDELLCSDKAKAEKSGWFDLKCQEKAKPQISLKLSCKDTKTVEREFWEGALSTFQHNEGSIQLGPFKNVLHSLGSTATEEEIDNFLKHYQLPLEGDIPVTAVVGALCDALHSNDASALAILPKNISSSIWDISVKVDDRHSNTSHAIFEHGLLHSPFHHRKAIILQVHNRKTGKLEEEKIPEYIHVAMSLMYASKEGRFAVDHLKVKQILHQLSNEQGKKYSSPHSKKDIEPFIKFHELNRAEMDRDPSQYANFNEFFFRKLKPGSRIVDSLNDVKICVSPTDCRLNVFSTIDASKEIWIKGKHFTLPNLLASLHTKNDPHKHQHKKPHKTPVHPHDIELPSIPDEEAIGIAKMFEGGSLAICRLAPQDYHRFHSPVDGKVVRTWGTPGTYFTVNPIAIREDVDVYTENKRAFLLIESPTFGNVCYITVGATMVGSIAFTEKGKVGESLKRGDEIGYFAFGGSTVLILFQKGKIAFDSDLLANSKKPIETLVQMGNHIGTACQ
jgi:phosphatidylserine decarboxylase